MTTFIVCALCGCAEEDRKIGCLLDVDEFQISQLTYNIIFLNEPSKLCAKCCQELALVGQLLFKWKEKILVLLECALEKYVVKKEEELVEVEEEVEDEEILEERCSDSAVEEKQPSEARASRTKKDARKCQQLEVKSVKQRPEVKNNEKLEVKDADHWGNDDESNQLLNSDVGDAEQGSDDNDEEIPRRPMRTVGNQRRQKLDHGEAEDPDNGGSDFDGEIDSKDNNNDDENSSDADGSWTVAKHYQKKKSQKELRECRKKGKLLKTMNGKFANKLSKSKHGLIVSENAKSESARKELMKKTQQDSKLDEAFNEQIENANSQEKEKRRGTFPCPLCKKIYRMKFFLDMHLKEHDAVYHCQYCVKTFKKKMALKTHVAAHEEEGQWKCDQCDKTFNRNGALRSHKYRIHGGKEKLHLCRFCPAKFWDKSVLTAHERIHTKERPFKCRHCDKTFREIRLRKQHEEAMHVVRAPMWPCDICGNVLRSRSSRDSHKKLQHAPPKIPCPYNCGKMFRRNQGAKDHGKCCPLSKRIDEVPKLPLLATVSRD